MKHSILLVIFQVFVNKSSTINFNPTIKINEKGKFNKSYLLYDLVCQLSPLFSKTIAENEINYLIQPNTQKLIYYQEILSCLSMVSQ